KYFPFILIFVLFMVMATNGCATRNNQTTPTPVINNELKEKPPALYFPLSLGSIWEYQGDGNEYASFKREVIFSAGTRYQIKEDNGGTVMAKIYEITDDSITLVFSEGEVYKNTNLLNSQANENILILKTPLITGNKWQTKEGSREIMATNAEITTPLGTYANCIKVKITDQYSTSYEYFKEGVGMVYREFNFEETKISSGLKAYKPGK
ncbi:MAG: hypothetical protein HGA27_04100, partial [Peptococcaceae bacterium]|nr:hypothetical protein [Peptococcaceae bacterium]